MASGQSSCFIPRRKPCRR